MNYWDLICSELTNCDICLQDNNVTFMKSNKSMSIPEAIKYIKQNIKTNKEFLHGLWDQLSLISTEITFLPANEETTKLFVSAVKHLANIALDNDFLKDTDIPQRLEYFLFQDSDSYSQKTMRKVIEYRLAIDWVLYLIQYDMHRSNLLRIISLGKDEVERIPVKTAQMYGRDFSFNDGQNIQPWDIIEDTFNHWFKEKNPKGRSEWGRKKKQPELSDDRQRDRSELEQSHDLRHITINDPYAPKAGKSIYLDHWGGDYEDLTTGENAAVEWDNLENEGMPYSQRARNKWRGR